ncbi:MAG: hypothetical protein WA120_07440, partial [Candidatus Hydromicrobium sp.]
MRLEKKEVKEVSSKYRWSYPVSSVGSNLVKCVSNFWGSDQTQLLDSSFNSILTKINIKTEDYIMDYFLSKEIVRSFILRLDQGDYVLESIRDLISKE